MEQLRNLDFLKKLPFFKGWSLLQLQDFNHALSTTAHGPGSNIFTQGASPNDFYIVKSGTVVQETIIEFDDYNRFPASMQEYSVIKKRYKVKYKISELKEGAIFGQDEIFLEIPR